MKSISYFIILSFALVSCNSANSQSSQTETPEKINQRFFDLNESKGPKEALEFIFSTNNWIDDNQTLEVINKLSDLTNKLGALKGKELIAKRSIGENYILYSYLIRYERQPLRFSFIYYKPNNIWQLQNFQYDDNLDTEIIEAANAYRLTENLPGKE